MIRFSGSRKAFGEYYGQRLKAYHHDFFNHTNAKTLRKQLNIYQKYYPELVAEKIAAAESLHQNPDFLLYEDLANFVDAQRRQCLSTSGTRYHRNRAFRSRNLRRRFDG